MMAESSATSSSDPSLDAHSDTSGTDVNGLPNNRVWRRYDEATSRDGNHDTHHSMSSGKQQRVRYSGSFPRVRYRPTTATSGFKRRTSHCDLGKDNKPDTEEDNGGGSARYHGAKTERDHYAGSPVAGGAGFHGRPSRSAGKVHSWSSRNGKGFVMSSQPPADRFDGSSYRNPRTRVVASRNKSNNGNKSLSKSPVNDAEKNPQLTPHGTSDTEHIWKFRPPPRGLTANEYSLCYRISSGQHCAFGNQCTMAHCLEELEEWKEYFEIWKTKIKQTSNVSTQRRDCQFAEKLVEKWMNAEHPETILAESLDGVKVYVTTDLSVNVNSKTATHSWLFTIATKLSLSRVVLLESLTREQFYIDAVTVGPKLAQKPQQIEPFCQQWINHKFTLGKSATEKVFRIKVNFTTDIYGTFRQSLALVFSEYYPAVVRQLCVNCQPVDTELSTLNKQLVTDQTDNWSLAGKTLVQFEPRPSNMLEDDLHLLEKYPSPFGSDFTISPALLEPTVTIDNYRTRMHHLLYIEEIAQYTRISQYNMKVDIELIDRFMLIPGSGHSARFAQNGEIFAQVTLDKKVSEDTVEGRLVLYNVNTVYLVPAQTNSPSKHETAYEALVEEKAKTVIYLRLSSRCVADLALKTGKKLAVTIQFNLNRVPLCEVHQAVDRVSDLRLIFPDFESSESLESSITELTQKHSSWKYIDESRLNVRQKNAVLVTTAPVELSLPPVLILGPYGTGKTFTLAQAAIEILQQPDTRVLICTHSNSAADLYIKDYIDPFVIGGRHPEAVPLRVVYRHRWTQAIHQTVLKYCLLNTDSMVSGGFRMPSIGEVKRYRLVVATLSTSRYLCDLGLDKGFFTHILIDEVAQATECECLLALNLATASTRIVLAGDHMQLNPEVYSEFARSVGLNKSLLERLFERYSSLTDSLFARRCTVQLTDNYRSHAAIIDLTSELFYSGGLVAGSDQPAHKDYYPLSFFTARGDDEQHTNSTAFYNNAEVYEVVDRVTELQRNWPQSWGPFNPSSIGVVTPYHDQVLRIRSELRKRKLMSVCVERVSNVQGKEFRVIFLSTVRTHRTCTTNNISAQDDVDYGFLSNVKLMNTAITRAQSLVAVVGDPVALCTIGNCRNFWLRYLEICNVNRSLHGITWPQLQCQLDHVELKKTYILNPDAPEFVPNRLRHATLSGPAAAATSNGSAASGGGAGRVMAGVVGGATGAAGGANSAIGGVKGGASGYYASPHWFPQSATMSAAYTTLQAQMMAPYVSMPYLWTAGRQLAVDRSAAIFGPAGANGFIPAMALGGHPFTGVSPQQLTSVTQPLLHYNQLAVAAAAAPQLYCQPGGAGGLVRPVPLMVAGVPASLHHVGTLGPASATLFTPDDESMKRGTELFAACRSSASDVNVAAPTAAVTQSNMSRLAFLPNACNIHRTVGSGGPSEPPKLTPAHSDNGGGMLPGNEVSELEAERFGCRETVAASNWRQKQRVIVNEQKTTTTTTLVEHQLEVDVMATGCVGIGNQRQPQTATDRHNGGHMATVVQQASGGMRRDEAEDYPAGYFPSHNHHTGEFPNNNHRAVEPPGWNFPSRNQHSGEYQSSNELNGNFQAQQELSGKNPTTATLYNCLQQQYNWLSSLTPEQQYQWLSSLSATQQSLLLQSLSQLSISVGNSPGNPTGNPASSNKSSVFDRATPETVNFMDQDCRAAGFGESRPAGNFGVTPWNRESSNRRPSDSERSLSWRSPGAGWHGNDTSQTNTAGSDNASWRAPGERLPSWLRHNSGNPGTEIPPEQQPRQFSTVTPASTERPPLYLRGASGSTKSYTGVLESTSNSNSPSSEARRLLSNGNSSHQSSDARNSPALSPGNNDPWKNVKMSAWPGQSQPLYQRYQ